MAGGAGHRFDRVFTEQEGQASRLQGLFERLETVTVLNLDDVPALFQQLLEAMAQVRSQAVDTGSHGIAGIDRSQQVQWAVQRAPG
ncbi:hypothetical protein D3C80_1578080 [compost metagenome]